MGQGTKVSIAKIPYFYKKSIRKRAKPPVLDLPRWQGVFGGCRGVWSVGWLVGLRLPFEERQTFIDGSIWAVVADVDVLYVDASLHLCIE